MDAQRLENLLRRIDGRPYPAYRDLRGAWTLGEVELSVDHVQGDPFAAPSRIRLGVQTGIAAEVCADADARRAAEDWLLRRFVARLSSRSRGSGRSGCLEVAQPGQAVVERSALRLSTVRSGWAEVRMWAGLPARGRRVLGRAAHEMLTEDLMTAAQILMETGDAPSLHAHIESVQRQVDLRAALRPAGLVAFVADGAVLPRRSGVDPRPLEDAVPFASPDALQVVLQTRSGPVAGMGLPEGVTVITGGGFHGKSTLLAALQWGHLDHIPGDGREAVVADPDTVKVRAEDGRRVEKVDVSAFLSDLPGGRSTRPLSTDDASGSTSQAAAVVEALESGARVLLLDEDTCATNLMVRDGRMRALIGDAAEPITPLVERIRGLYTERGVSTVLVVGGVGDYLAVADHVVQMRQWRPLDVTAQARAIAGPPPPQLPPMADPWARRPVPSSLRPTGKGRVRARDGRRVEYGQEEIDLAAVEQLATAAAARSAGRALAVMSEVASGRSLSIPELLDAVDALLRGEGPDALSPFETPVGDLEQVRRHELAACLNRLRTLVIEDGQ